MAGSLHLGLYEKITTFWKTVALCNHLSSAHLKRMHSHLHF